jgi:2-polyprenyl-3-methyl-5-hydroxy-6-metoxy-1,4-benzoquinol methylase
MKYELEEKKCDICGSSNTKVLHEQIRDGSTVVLLDEDNRPFNNIDVMCMDCGLVFKTPSFTRSELARFYETDYSELYRPGWKKTISKSMLAYTLFQAVTALDWLKARMKLAGKTMLEIGSGDGVFARLAAAEGVIVTPIDVDQRACEIAKKLHGITTVQEDFMTSGKINEKYDIVCLRNTLEHMYSPMEALSRAVEFMNEDGIILVELPSAAMPYPAIPIGAFLSGAHNYTFLPETVSLIAEKCGLGVRDLQFAGHNACMLAILDKNKSNETYINQAEDIFPMLQERYTEHNNTFFQQKEIVLKLLNESNVTIIVDTIKSLKHTSNLITHLLLTQLPSNREGLRKMSAIFDGYTWNGTQAWDIQCCAGTFEFFRGMFYREVGDFTRAIEQFRRAKFLYPRITDNNAVKEMMLEGIMSDSVFGEYFWYSNEKVLKAVS